MQSTSTSYSITPFGVNAYRNSVQPLALGREEEAALVELARSGDQGARQQLIESVLIGALGKAMALARFYREVLGVELDAQDIAQEAALRALQRLEKALAAPSPVGYLRLAMEGAMRTYCRERQSAIRVPAPVQSRKGIKPFEVLSLNAPTRHDNMTLESLLSS